MYKLHQNVLPVSGYLRTALYDLQQENYHFISNGLLKGSKKLNSEHKHYSYFLEHLNELEVLNTLSVNSRMFPELTLDFAHPSVIEMIMVEVSNNKLFDYSIVLFVSQLNIKSLLFFVNSHDALGVLEYEVLMLKGTPIENVEIVFTFNSKSKMSFLDGEHRIRKIFFYDTEFKKIDVVGNKINAFFDYAFAARQVQIQHPNYFNVNITLFTESQAHHTYFNRKLYIGPSGEIKNAPECEETFGYIQDLESPEQLKDIVQSPEFQKYWYVHKGITDVCKDCEFRHMCVDNRLPYQRTENEWYHKQECNYNPYIAKWKGEEGYRTLAECGVISNENGFSIDHEKIVKFNDDLWGGDE
jgi:SPASM domain peptide maturase of grasp-with-spasm system